MFNCVVGYFDSYMGNEQSQENEGEQLQICFRQFSTCSGVKVDNCARKSQPAPVSLASKASASLGRVLANRLLPLTIELEVLAFSGPEELSALLATCGAAHNLVKRFLQTTRRVPVPYQPLPNQATLFSYILQNCKQLRRIEMVGSGCWPAAGVADFLVKIVLANQATLQSVCGDEIASLVHENNRLHRSLQGCASADVPEKPVRAHELPH